MTDTNPAAPLRDMRSTVGMLVTAGTGGQQTSRPINVVHAPGVTPPKTVTHDATGCGCQL